MKWEEINKPGGLGDMGYTNHKDESPTQSQVGNTTQGEEEYNKLWEQHKELASRYFKLVHSTPSTQSEGEERLYTMEEVHQFTRESIEYLTAKSSLFQELQALRLSNEQGDKLVIELQGNLDDQKVKMGEMTNMWLEANEENRSLRLSNSKLEKEWKERVDKICAHNKAVADQKISQLEFELNYLRELKAMIPEGIYDNTKKRYELQEENKKLKEELTELKAEIKAYQNSR